MGSIQKRGKDTYFLTVSKGFGLNGKRKRYTKTVTVPDEKAEKLLPKILAAFEAEIDSGNFKKPTQLTFEAFAREWLEKYAEKNLRKKTYARYKQLLELRIIPAFQKFKLEQITPLHLMEFYDNLKNHARLDGREGKLSDRTIKHHHRLLSTMFSHAVKWQLIKDNPAARVDAPKVKQTEAKFYDEESLMILIAALNTAPLKYRIIVLLTIYTGMRRSEVLGLRWQDIDMKRHQISIVQSSQYVPAYGKYIDELKTTTSKRVLSIPAFFADLFKKIQAEQKVDCKALKQADITYQYNPSGLVFVNALGNSILPDNLSNWLPKFIKQYNKKLSEDSSIPEENKQYLPALNFHGLRHTHATLLISENMDILTISKRLGHSNTSTTLNNYGHLIKKADRVASDKFENLLNKNTGKSSECHQTTKKTSE